MQTLHLIADNNDEGIRLDAFLAQKSGETRSRIQNLIKDGCVVITVGGGLYFLYLLLTRKKV